MLDISFLFCMLACIANCITRLILYIQAALDSFFSMYFVYSHVQRDRQTGGGPARGIPLELRQGHLPRTPGAVESFVRRTAFGIQIFLR